MLKEQKILAPNLSYQNLYITSVLKKTQVQRKQEKRRINGEKERSLN